MRTWELSKLDIEAGRPQILSSSEDTRAIAIALPAGTSLEDHQVHERAWIMVAAGEVEITAADGSAVTGGPGLIAELDPAERHAVHATADARLLLLLTPWPGTGHPGAMDLDVKAHAREAAAERAGG